jgi:hypothetical protein
MSMNESFYYSIKIDFFQGDFERIRNIELSSGDTLLPPKVRIDSVTLEVDTARLYYSFYGIKKDGTESSRRTYGERKLPGDPRIWLHYLLPESTPYAQKDGLKAFWPKAEGTK